MPWNPANEAISANWATDGDLYAIVWSGSQAADASDLSAPVLETYDASHRALYAIPLTRVGDTTRFVGPFPQLPAGTYEVQVYEQAGDDPAGSDQGVWQQPQDWDGVGPVATLPPADPAPSTSPYTAYPTADDLAFAIQGLGLFDTTELTAFLATANLASHAKAAAAAWERLTGWRPFLASDADTTRYFDPPREGESLDLGTGLLAVTSITAGLGYDSLGAETGGTALVGNLHYFLAPEDSDRPADRLTRYGSWWGGRRSIKIVGRFGYAATVPDDAWLAILCGGLALAAGVTDLSATGGLSEWRIEQETQSFGSPLNSAILTHAKQWRATWAQGIASFRRSII